MSRRTLVLVLASSLTLCAAGSAAAQAAPRSVLPADLLDAAVGAPVVPESRFHTGFGIDPPGPYEVRVQTDGAAVVVSVIRGDRRKRVAVTNYLARGVAAPERLQATFGKLGKISMRFRESSHRPWHGKRRRCRGAGRFVVRRGVFVGSFRFRGEGGYLTVRAHRAKGSVSSVASKCRRQARRRGARSSSVFEDSFSGLIASDRVGVNSTVFGVLSFRGRLFYLAQREENMGRLAVLRNAIVSDRGRFPLNEAATVGRFSPGTPFHGTGRYRAAPDGSTSWSGDLAVDFPGAARFPLTGPTYETLLEAGF
jgi:hypothetical protein